MTAIIIFVALIGCSDFKYGVYDMVMEMERRQAGLEPSILKVDDFEIPGGVSGQYHYVHTNGASMVVPITEDGKIILVNQYRYLGERESVEFPCGSVKAGHGYLETAKLELQEETGRRAGHIEEVGRFNPYNGVTDEMCGVFIASQLEPAAAKPDATEEFELLYCSAREMDAMIRKKTIWDGMTLAAWTLAKHEVLEILSS